MEGCRIDEPRIFQTLSNARCPIYGNCNSCYISGPLNIQCSYYNGACKEFAYMFIIHSRVGTQKCIIDAEYFVSLMGVANDHNEALADRQYTWIRNNDHGILTHDYKQARCRVVIEIR